MPPLFFHINSYLLGEDSIDIDGNIWYGWFIKRCILKHNFTGLYHTDFVAYPTGKNLIFDLGFPLMHILFTPFQIFLNLPLSYNLFLITIVSINFLIFFYIINYLLKDKWVGIVGGIFFSINPYIIYHINSGRVNELAIFWLPLYILFLFKIKEEGNDFQLKNTILASSILIFTALTYWYYYIFLIILTLVYILSLPRETIKGMFLIKIVLVYTISIITITALFFPSLAKGIHPLGYKIVKPFPSYLSIVQNKTLPHFRYLIEETSLNRLSSFPLTFIFIIFILSIKSWRTNTPWLISGSLFFILSLGPYLYLFGRIFWSPYILLYYSIPTFPRLWWPINCFSITILCGAILVSNLIYKVTTKRNVKIAASLFLTIIYLAPFFNEQYKVWDSFLTTETFYYGPYRKINKAYHYLKTQPDCAIIELPFNKGNLDFLRNQIIHNKKTFNCPGYAIKEEMWPQRQLNFLRSNALLNYIDNLCSSENFKGIISEKEIKQSLKQLYNIGFRFIVINPEYFKNYHHKKKIMLEIRTLFKKPYKKFPDGIILYKIENMIKL